VPGVVVRGVSWSEETNGAVTVESEAGSDADRELVEDAHAATTPIGATAASARGTSRLLMGRDMETFLVPLLSGTRPDQAQIRADEGSRCGP
jgi:hypothetical protein